jgi:hypothetical protein
MDSGQGNTMYPAYQKINSGFSRTIVIGDIHGCYEEMRALLNKIQFNDRDLLISVGDLIDRGPLSWEVASFFKDTKNAYSVLGNHERRIAGVIRGTSQPAWSQSHTLSKIDEKEYDSWARYFESLPAVIETPHTIITHARLDPTKMITEQEPYHTCAVGGAAIKIDMDSNNVPLWHLQWKIKHAVAKPICVGHIDYNQITLNENKLFALDTSAVKGGRLTTVIFPEETTVSIDCHNYYSESFHNWRAAEFNRQLECLEHLPLHEIFRMEQKEQRTEHEDKLIQQFYILLKEYDFEGRTKSLRENLTLKLGKLPPPGEIRGEYFKTIRSHFDSSLNQRLIGLIFSEEPYQLDKLFKVFRKSALDDIASTYVNIETWPGDTD